MDNSINKSKKKIFKPIFFVFVLICLICGASYAAWNYTFIGDSNLIESTDVSIDFLEANDVIGVSNALPVSDVIGKYSDDVFDFVVTTNTDKNIDLTYTLSIEKMEVDEGYTSLSDSNVKVYLTDANDNMILAPTKISNLDNYNLYSNTNMHNKLVTQYQDKYKLRVWVDEDADVVDWQSDLKLQYNFKLKISSSGVPSVPRPMVNVVALNGSVLGNSTLIVNDNETATFTVEPTNSEDYGIVSCTNGQSASITGNTLTVPNVVGDSTCTVTFGTKSSVLYSDGTLIINENLLDRNANIALHGTVSNEYEALSNANSYVFTYDNVYDTSDVLWYDQRDSITNVNFGESVQPVSTSGWFAGLSNLASSDLANLNTSSVTDMSYMFYKAGISANTFESIGTFNIPAGCNVNYFASLSPLFSGDIYLNGSLSSYSSMFEGTATDSNARVNLNYVDSTTENIVDGLISLYGPSGTTSQGQIYKIEILSGTLMSEYVANNLVTSGDGIVYDADRNKYYYQGSSVNNYISIGGDLFRIIAFEPDGTMQIFQDQMYGRIAFDASGNRTTGNNSFCTSASSFISGSTTVYYGCNAFSSFANYDDGTTTGEVNDDSTLKTYLNTTVYNALNPTIKDLIIEHDFNVGPVTDTASVGKNTVCGEIDDYVWHGKVGTFNVGDLRYSGSGNMNFESTVSSYIASSPLATESFWTMNGAKGNTYDAMIIMKGKITKRRASRPDYNTVIYYVKPVVFISSNIRIEGTGTTADPFIIQ